MNESGARGLALLACLALGAAQAEETPASLPPPPAQPEVVLDPIEITPRVTAHTLPCDHVPGEAPQEDAPLRWTWTRGELHIRGRVMHNGVERIESNSIRAWQLHDNVAISYRIDTPDGSPFDLSVACPGFTHLDIRIAGIRARPAKLTVYRARLEFDNGSEVPAGAK